MFSTEDVREVVQALPPAYGHHGLPSCLVLTASGHGFVTLKQLRANYEHHVSQETSRIPVSRLAGYLDVSPDTIQQLAHTGHQLALLNTDKSEVISVREVESIADKLRESLGNGVLSNSGIQADYDIDSRGMRRLVDVLDDVVSNGDHLYTRAYDKRVSEQALALVNRVVTENTNIDLFAQDLNQLPESPPKWFLLHHLDNLASSSQHADKLFVRDSHDFIRIQSKQMKQRILDDWTSSLLSGEITYRDLLSLDPGHVLYPGIEEVVAHLKTVPGILVVDDFALSETWLFKLVHTRLQDLHTGETGIVDVAQSPLDTLGSGKEGNRSLHKTTLDTMWCKAEQLLTTALAQEADSGLHRFGTIVLTKDQYAIEQNNLLDQASENATSQWQQLSDSPNHELKFAMSNIASLNQELENNMSIKTISKSTVQSALAKERHIQRACEERFQATISSLETENETAFATFWLERVASRVHIYTEGLTSISDSKLQDQLSELLATYIQKELVPEAISKARTQSLVMSRRTRKNVDKLESTISTSATDMPSLLSALEKFHKKQNTSAPTPNHKKSMIQDMHRRLQKASDGPVLFLTSVVVLYAKYNAGVVYATGKFAPKLMKLLKGKIGEDEYEKLEKWKEGAKKGSLTKEDKEGMRGMAMATLET